MGRLVGRRLLILTEGDRARGLGHVVRCGAWAAEWLARGGEVDWRLDGDALARDAAAGLGRVAVEDWKTGGDWPSSDVVIVDSYALTPSLAARLSARDGLTVFVDDLQALTYPGGWVLHAAPDEVCVHGGAAKWLTGPSWQPLRPPFRAPPARGEARTAIAQVLVVMGGSDARGLAAETARLTAERLAGSSGRVEVRLAGLDQAPPGVRPLGKLDAAGMAAEMAACDLAVSAAGQTIFELARCGAPTIMLGVAGNQAPNLRGWPPLAGFIDAGMWDAPDLKARLAMAIEAMHPRSARQAVTKRAMAAVDGRGAERLIDRLERAGEATWAKV